MATGLLDEIKDFLVAAHLGTFGTDLFIGYRPDAPDAVTSLYNGGGPPVEYHSAGSRPILHVEVRATTQDAALQKMTTIIAALHNQHDFTIDTKNYVQCRAAQPEPILIEHDSQNRWTYAMNFQFIKEPGFF